MSRSVDKTAKSISVSWSNENTSKTQLHPTKELPRLKTANPPIARSISTQMWRFKSKKTTRWFSISRWPRWIRPNRSPSTLSTLTCQKAVNTSRLSIKTALGCPIDKASTRQTPFTRQVSATRVSASGLVRGLIRATTRTQLTGPSTTMTGESMRESTRRSKISIGQSTEKLKPSRKSGRTSASLTWGKSTTTNFGLCHRKATRAWTSPSQKPLCQL